MPEQTGTPATNQRAGFFREGWREMGRKLERRRLRKQAERQDRERNEALTSLGRQAWQEKADVSAFPELCEPLSRLDDRAGELNAAAKSLEAENATLAQRRSAESAKFDSQRRAVEEKKQPVDATLQSTRARHGDRERAVQQMQTRMAAVDSELLALEEPPAATAASPAPDLQAQLAASLAKKQQLLAEKAQLANNLPAAQAELPGSAAELNRLTADSQRFAEEIRKIEEARQAVFSEIDASLARVRSQLQGSQQQTAAVEQERKSHFAALGLALYGQKAAAASLAGPIQQIASLDQARDATQSALQASRAQTSAMPRGTMLKFSAVTLLAPAVMFAAAAGIYSGWNQVSPSSGGERRQGTVSVPRKPRCEPLQMACEHAQTWQDCAEAHLGEIANDVATAHAQLDAEWATRSAPPEQAAIWHPQYIALRTQLDSVIPAIAEMQGEVAAAATLARADCSELPGPEDRKLCEDAAQRVEKAIKEARENTKRDLDTKLAGPKSVLQTQGAAWPSVITFLAQLQVRQAALQQCQ
jgi:predicted nuclease with TOPRIM domain